MNALSTVGLSRARARVLLVGLHVTHTPGSGVYVIVFPCGTFSWDLDNFVFHVLQHVGPNVPGKAPSQNAKAVVNP